MFASCFWCQASFLPPFFKLFNKLKDSLNQLNKSPAQPLVTD